MGMEPEIMCGSCEQDTAHVAFIDNRTAYIECDLCGDHYTTDTDGLF